MKTDYKEVVISGIGGAFPNCANIDEFRERLLKNECLLTSRWEEDEFGVTNVIGAINGVDLFDASYFGIHNAQCTFLDPQHRLALERTFEALIDAGVSPTEIRGKKVGVFAGCTVGENDTLLYEAVVSGFGITGHARSMMPNRISYWLNLSGPSSAFDSNWTCGVDVLQAAFESVREGFCESAIVVTTNLLMNPEVSYHYNEMGLLSPNGVTKSFDNDANGYARSDGVVVLFIQPAKDAKRSYATILGAEASYNGIYNGTVANMDKNGMKTFLEEFYQKHNVDVNDIDFIECYGSGLKNIDEIELNAIDEVFGKKRNKPILIGSVKPNTGHAEASSVLFSVAKVLIAMESETIPANINYNTPNKNVPALAEGRIEVLTKNRQWNPNIIAINAAGFSSSYGHILLQANPKSKKQECSSLPLLLTISTRTDDGIQKSLEFLKNNPSVDPEFGALIHDTFKQSIHNHLYRGYAVLNAAEPQTACDYYPGKKRQIWFIYSGMGSQWCKMASDLMALPVFAQSINYCHKILETKGLDLIDIITRDDDKIFDNILHAFVGIAAMQIALTDVLRLLGIVPDGIMGHSVGELGCAYADNCLTAEQMILCAYSRGIASREANLIKGMMAAIGMEYDKLKEECPPTVEIACHNSKDSCTISGPAKDVEAFVEDLKAKGVFAKLVNVSNIAYHSTYIKPAGPLLLKYLQDIIPHPIERSSKWISTSIPQEEWESDLAKTSSAEYHTNNLLSPVRFAASSKLIPKDAIVIEIAPHGLLQAILKRSLPPTCTNVPLTNKSSKNGLAFFLNAIGKLYVTGLEVKVAALYPPVTYPVSRGTKSLIPLVHWEHGEKWRTGKQVKSDYLACVDSYQISLQSEKYQDLIENQVDRNVIIPVSKYLELLLEIYSYVYKNLTNVVFEKLKFENILNVPKLGLVPLYIMISKGGGEFEITSGSQLIVNGIIKCLEGDVVLAPITSLEEDSETFCLSESNIYSEFSHRGHQIQGSLKNVKELNVYKNGTIAKIHWNNSWTKFIDGMFQQYLFSMGQQDQLNYSIATIRRILVNLAELPKESCDVQSTYDYSTGDISTEQIQISGLSVKPLPTDLQAVAFDSVEFSDFEDTTYKNIETGINFAFHLAMQNSEKQTDSITIVEIETNDQSLDENIRNVFKTYKSITVNISKVCGAETILVSPSEPLLVIINGVIDNTCVKFLTASHAFLLAKSNENISSYPQIIEVAKFSVDDVPYSILRKAFEIVAEVIHITTKELEFEDPNFNYAWTNNLKSALSKHDNKRIYLAFDTIPRDGIENFVNNIRQYFNNPNIRFVFKLDEYAPTFNINEKGYASIFKKDLIVTVIKNRSIGNYVPIPITSENYEQHEMESTDNITGDIEYQYLGIHALDETITDKKITATLGNIDYAGTTKTGKLVMGLAHFDAEHSKLIQDPILCWNVPHNWSTNDAVTIPHAYSMAYYILLYAIRMNHGETVLVHGGCSPLGLAAISIAINYNCQIFVTVLSHTQKAFLKKQYRNIPDRNIMDARNSSFEPSLLMATGGKGASVILNCLSGSMLNATLRCVAEFGRIVLVGQLDLEENADIGMKVFLNNVSVVGISTKDVLNASPEVKKEIYEYIKNGIQYVSVRPLRRTIVEDCELKSALSLLKHPEHVGNVIVKLSKSTKLSQLNTADTQQITCDSRETYLLLGGQPDMYVDIIEWIALRGGKHIIVATNSRPEKNDIIHRLALLETYFNINVEYIPAFSNKNIPNKELLRKLRFIFILPNCCKQTDYEPLKEFLVECFSNKLQKVQVVNFSTELLGICYNKKFSPESSFFNIQYQNSIKFSDVVRALDRALSMKRKSIFVKDQNVGDKLQETTQHFYEKLDYVLPNSISQILTEAAQAPLKTRFDLLPSLVTPSPREIPPVFIIPGMFTKNLVKELSSHLLYPAYCATFPLEYSSLESLARDLAEDMQTVYPEGPYNVIGLSYSGPLAIEIVKNLEHKNRTVQLYLIEGAPDTVNGSLKYLGEGSFRETSSLCRILNITNLDVRKNMNNLQGWNKKLQFALDHTKSSSEEKMVLSKAITTLLKFLADVSYVTPNKTLIAGPVHLLVPDGSSKYDDCGLLKYIKLLPKIHVVNGDSSTIMYNVHTANILNNDVIFKY